MPGNYCQGWLVAGLSTGCQSNRKAQQGQIKENKCLNYKNLLKTLSLMISFQTLYLLFKSAHSAFGQVAQVSGMLTLLGYLPPLEVRQEGVGGQAEVSSCLLLNPVAGHQYAARGARMPEKLEKETTIRGSTTDLREKVYVTVPR